MEFLYCILIGYFIGTFNPAYLFAKKKGVDIRKKGSGNAGASNALVLFGKVVGVMCAIIDIAKAYFAIFLAEKLFPEFTYAFAVTSVFCILGHIFPFYMKFKGGKGLACLGGMVLYYNWQVFLIMLTLELVIALTTGYICFVPVTASFIFPIVYAFIERDVFGTVILFIVSVVMIIKHFENFRRIKNGTEIHLSYLWKPKEELERVKSSSANNKNKFE